MNLSFQIGNRTFSFGSKPPENSQPQAPPQTQTRSSPVQAWLGSCYPNGADSILCSPYEQSVWVYTVVSALAQTISAIPFRISKGDRSGETILTKGPLVD